MTDSIVPSNFSQDNARQLIKFIFDEATIREDGLVNITALYSAYFRATGKRKDSANWLVTKQATESIAYLERVTGIPVSSLVMAEHGVGTWVHPDLAELAALHCSVEYRFAVVQLIRTAKSQKVELVPTPVPQLPSRELAVETAIAIDRIQDILSKSNPRLAQILIDCAMNDIVDFSRALPSSNDFPEDKWYGLVQIADKMGIKTNLSTRGKLGTHVSQLIDDGLLDVERVREERLCNGQQRKIWCYHDNDIVRNAIQNWADSLAE